MTTAPDRSTAPVNRAAECIEEAARLVAANPGAAEHLLTRHRPDRLGRCTGCGQSRPRSPCTLVTIAERARTLAVEVDRQPVLEVVITGPRPIIGSGRAPTPGPRPR